MNAQSFDNRLFPGGKWQRTLCRGGLLLAFLGCSRSTVVMAPDNAPRAEEAIPAKIVARGQADEAEENPFAFPEDAGGLLLAKTLPPQDPDAMLPVADPLRESESHRSEPAPALSSDFLTPPVIPLPPSHAAVPSWPDDRRSLLQPHLVFVETLEGLADQPRLPQAPALPESGRIRAPSPDVNQPIPLPILAKPVSDRVSLEDPTLSASTAAATAATIPARTRKAPFLKQTLPDPYDHRRTGVPAAEESPDFPLGSPRTPRR
ncbi:MAG: hypothetical protein ACYC3I_18830 [Gemmataceae bacterium]